MSRPYHVALAHWATSTHTETEMKTKVSELAGAALDWAVATAEGATEEWRAVGPFWWGVLYPAIREDGRDIDYRPSRDGGYGSQIIEREKIGTLHVDDGDPLTLWSAYIDRPADNWFGHGPTHLIAAMRCYVASKLGDTIDIPEELLK